MQIIKPRERNVPETRYTLFFEREGSPGSGFGFPCSKEGAPLVQDLAAQENLRLCLAGEMPGVSRTPIVEEWTGKPWWSDAVGQCEECHRHVELRGYTNACDCGADYDRGGHRLAPREFWGEETGESYADILQADIDPWGGDY